MKLKLIHSLIVILGFFLISKAQISIPYISDEHRRCFSYRSENLIIFIQQIS